MRLWSQEGSACHRAMAQSVVPKEAALLFQEQKQSSRESPRGAHGGTGGPDLGVRLSGHICRWSC